MRRALAVCLVVLGTVPSVSGQSNLDGARITHIVALDSAGGLSARMPVMPTGFYVGEPSARIPAQALPGSTLRASRFTVRAWQEGDKTRVVVYAVVQNKNVSRDVETPIATHAFALQSNDFGPHVVTETAEWGAAPIVLTAAMRIPISR